MGRVYGHPLQQDWCIQMLAALDMEDTMWNVIANCHWTVDRAEGSTEFYVPLTQSGKAT